MTRPVRRRRGGPTTTLVCDLIRDVAWSRSLLVTLVLLMSAAAAALAFAGQAVAPWTIYPAL